VQRYAERLEAVVRKYPYQWANFYPYWEQRPETPPAARPVPNPA
jgi:predicted LPLAT superfamily acyltransferase